MKRISILVLAIALHTVFAQSEESKWYFTLANQEPKLKEENQFIISADLPEGWGLYSSDFTPVSIGPTPTIVEFEPECNFSHTEPLRAINSLQAEDEGFGLRYSYFISRAEFRQCIILKQPVTKIKGTIRGQLFHLQTGKTQNFEKTFEYVITLNN